MNTASVHGVSTANTAIYENGKWERILLLIEDLVRNKHFKSILKVMLSCDFQTNLPNEETGLISSSSSHHENALAPRCRLI